jgi:glycyl-tRNA synthetase beta subunit
MTAMARPTRLMRGKEAGAGTEADLDTSLMGVEEMALYLAYKGVVAKLAGGGDVSFADFLEACTALAEPVDLFFEKVCGLLFCLETFGLVTSCFV